MELVRALVAQQFPQWADLDVREVDRQGWDNRTYRLGTDLSVRLPSADGYAPQVDREHRWLPFLRDALPTPIPVPLAKGAPSAAFPRAWSVYRWLDGVPLDEAGSVALEPLAADVATFLTDLRGVPNPEDSPVPEASNGYRGGDFCRYSDEGEEALSFLAPPLRPEGREWLKAATRSRWTSAPVWVHGDMAAGNLLTRHGRLAAVIDFGCLAVGDPACDLIVAWTIFEEDSRETFRRSVGLDDDTWRRARGWALWKAAVTLASASAGSAQHHAAELTVRQLWEDGT